MQVSRDRINYYLAEGLGHYFHRDVIRFLIALKEVLVGTDAVTTAVVQMLVCITMTGHSPGYLSVRTMPPNQQIPPDRQQKLNEKAHLVPIQKNIVELLWQRFQRLIKDEPPRGSMQEISTQKADLLITSPPFLDVIDYNSINWIRIFWLGSRLTTWHLLEKSLDQWKIQMKMQMAAWREQLIPGARVCIEAGSVRKNKINLIEELISLAPEVGYIPEKLYIQQTSHSRTARCWGVQKDQGTTSQQVAVFRLG